MEGLLHDIKMTLQTLIQDINLHMRCTDCVCLVEYDGDWFCDQLDQLVSLVIDCPEDLKVIE